MHGAVQREGEPERLAAGDRDLTPPGKSGCSDARLNRRAAARSVGDLSSVEWQLEDPLVLDHLADAGIAGVHDRRGCFDRDALFELAHPSTTSMTEWH